MPRPTILVTNDDGIHAPGIALLAAAMADIGDVVVCAPLSEQSAVGHGISLHRPLRAEEIEPSWYWVDGTPTDCVLLAVRRLLRDRKPQLVVSGVNRGPNLGDDVTYSGTVAGAYEGMLQGIPSIAVSTAAYHPAHQETGATVAARIAERVLQHGLPPDCMLNVNVPDCPYEDLAGIAVTRMGRRSYEDVIIERNDPRDRTYYWIGGEGLEGPREDGTDITAIEQLKASVTPLHRDVTNYEALKTLHNTPFSLQ